MKSILIYSQSDFSRDPRVLKHVAALNDDYEITVMGTGAPPDDVAITSFVDIGNILVRTDPKLRKSAKIKDLLHRYPIWKVLVYLLDTLLRGTPFFRGRIFLDRYVLRRAIRQYLKMNSFDLVLANDLSGLTACEMIADSSKLIFDAHEYSVGQLRNSTKFDNRYRMKVLRDNLPKCAAIITVSSGLARLYQDNFGLEKVNVIENRAPFQDLLPGKVDGKLIKIVHHGVASPNRRIEDMISILAHAGPRYVLDLYLVNNDDNYYQELTGRAAQAGNVRLCPTVPLDEIPVMLNKYDLGLVYFPPMTLNLKFVLPNKFFEFIQGRLGIISGPSPDMCRYIENYEIGVSSREFDPKEVGELLQNLSIDDIEKLKRNSHQCAKELSAAVESEKLRHIIESL